MNKISIFFYLKNLFNKSFKKVTPWLITFKFTLKIGKYI